MSVEYVNGSINGNTNGNLNGNTNGFKYAKFNENKRLIANNLVNRLDEKIKSSELEHFKINKVIENAIHWCLVNGE